MRTSSQTSLVVVLAALTFLIVANPVVINGEESGLIEGLLRSNPVCAPVIAEAEKYEVQILYTQIDRDENNHPRFTRHAFRVDPQAYFYPASTIKLEVLRQLCEVFHLRHFWRWGLYNG